MKKFTLGILVTLGFGIGAIFAQNILPDSAKIEVKSPIIEGEATNLSITMMKNGSIMKNYDGTIYMGIEDENGSMIKQTEYKLPNGAIYQFLETDLGTKEFQKGLEINKEGKYYLTVTDLNDLDEKILGKELITVVKKTAQKGDHHVEVYAPLPESSIASEKVDILANVPDLQNSKALIYIDDDPAITVDVDSTGIINHSVTNLKIGRHSLRIEIPDIDGSTLGTSDKIYFNVIEGNNVTIKEVKVYPEKNLMVGDKVKITVLTDEMVESVKMKLSDRPENSALILTKDGAGEFSYNLYLISTGEVNISLETTTSNNSAAQTHENVKKMFVIETPEIGNVTTITDDEKQSAVISWEIINGDPVNSYLVKYRGSGTDISGEEETQNKSFTFRDVPYDTEINVNIIPIRKNSLNLQTHGAAAQSKTIKFVITKLNTCGNGTADPGEDCTTCAQDLGDQCPALVTCGNGTADPGEDCTTCAQDLGDQCKKEPRCTVQNIATHTTKIGNNYYLIRDKIDNVTKYIVYSSPSPDGLNKVKVYETSDTSYEYPFDYNAKEEQFMYFRIVGICDDGEELELTGATKVQVGPAENFFLLVCLTFLIYFGIKLFRETE